MWLMLQRAKPRGIRTCTVVVLPFKNEIAYAEEVS
jgi:hypothetical protein